MGVERDRGRAAAGQRGRGDDGEDADDPAAQATRQAPTVAATGAPAGATGEPTWTSISASGSRARANTVSASSRSGWLLLYAPRTLPLRSCTGPTSTWGLLRTAPLAFSRRRKLSKAGKSTNEPCSPSKRTGKLIIWPTARATSGR